MDTRTLPDGTIVARYGIIGTGTTVYRAYRPSSIMGPHHSIESIGGAWYGDVATARLPAELDALPAMSAERRAAVDEWHAGLYAESRRLIVQAFPEASAGIADMGSIRTEATR